VQESLTEPTERLSQSIREKTYRSLLAEVVTVHTSDDLHSTVLNFASLHVLSLLQQRLQREEGQWSAWFEVVGKVSNLDGIECEWLKPATRTTAREVQRLVGLPGGSKAVAIDGRNNALEPVHAFR